MGLILYIGGLMGNLSLNGIRATPLAFDLLTLRSGFALPDWMGGEFGAG